MIKYGQPSVTYRLPLAALSVGLLCGQTQQSPQDLLKEAVAFHQQGKLNDAIRDYELFLDMYPNAPEVRSNLGAALVASGKYLQAIEQYKLALLAKQDTNVRLNLGLAYYKAAQYVNAAQELAKVHEAEPTSQQATMLLADCGLRLGENKKAIELLTPLRQKNPGDAGIAYLLGTALARDGQTAEAQTVIQQILGAGESAEARLLIGTTKFAANDFTGALEDLRQAVKLNPALPDAYTYYGLALFSKGEMEESKKAFQTALSQDPNNFEANLHIGIMFRQDQDTEHALPYIRKALSLRPGNVSVRYQLALIMLAQNKEESARDELEAIVKEAPTFTEAHVTLSIIYFREKRKDDGNRERAIVQKLNEQRQALEPGARTVSAQPGDKPAVNR